MTTFVDEATGLITVPDTQIASRWELITPEMAKEYLNKNTSNRKLRGKHLERLTRDMVNNNYLITHQGIAVSDHNVLIDGQHRLSAIIESGQPQWMLVTTGLPMKTQEEVDGGAKRHAGDLGMLAAGGYGHTKTAAVRMLLTIEAIDHLMSPNEISRHVQDFTTADLQQAYAERWHEDIDRVLSLAINAAKRTRGRVGASAFMAGAVYYPDRATEFLRGVADNAVGLPDSDPRTALLRFQGTGRIQVPVSAFIAFKAMRYFHYGQPISVLRYRNNEVMDLRKAPKPSGPWGGKKNAKNGDEA